MIPEVSIVIPTYNEEEDLPKLLQDIGEQSYRELEVIVADAGSKDRTREKAEAAGARVVEGGMPAEGRNAGAAVARGRLLVFLDADVRMDSRFLERAVAEMRQRELELATCRVRPISELALDRIMHDFANLYVRINQYSNPHAPGYCIFVHRELFDRVDGFDTTLQVAEDHDFVKRASKHAPLRVLLDPVIKVSVRRMEKDGRLNYIWKSVLITFYRMFKGEIRDEDVVEYDFEDYAATDARPFQRHLRRIEKTINRLDRKLSDFERGSLSSEQMAGGMVEMSDQIEKQMRALGGKLGKVLRKMSDQLREAAETAEDNKTTKEES